MEKKYILVLSVLKGQEIVLGNVYFPFSTEAQLDTRVDYPILGNSFYPNIGQIFPNI